MSTGIVDPELSQPWAVEGASRIGAPPVAGEGGERGTASFEGNADWTADVYPTNPASPGAGGPGIGLSYHQTESPVKSPTWGPDANDRESSTNTSTAKGASSVVLTAASLTPVHAVADALTATITGGVDGEVTFKDGATVLGTADVNAGVAHYADAGFTVGAHVLTAAYSGDESHAAATSPAITVTAS